MSGEFDGRVALITGGASGVGEATAHLLAKRGACVIVAGPDMDAAAAVTQAIEADGGAAVAVAADVRDWAQVEAAARKAVGVTGQLDVLVASAGIQRYGTAADTDPDLWDEVFAVNVRGAFLAAKAAIPHIRRSRHGAVALVSSVQAFATQSNVAAYTASKGALNALARSMAVDEAAHGVRVNAVCPGSVDTPMLRESARLFSDGTPRGIETMIGEWGAAHPLRRVATPREVAEVIAFLVSERSSFVTGESIRVDGGLAIHIAADVPTDRVDGSP